MDLHRLDPAVLVHEVEIDVPADRRLILRGQLEELVAAVRADGLGFALVDGVTIVDAGDEHGPGRGRLALKGDGAGDEVGEEGLWGTFPLGGRRPQQDQRTQAQSRHNDQRENKPPHHTPPLASFYIICLLGRAEDNAEFFAFSTQRARRGVFFSPQRAQRTRRFFGLHYPPGRFPPRIFALVTFLKLDRTLSCLCRDCG